MTTTKEKIEIMQAFEDGKTIERCLIEPRTISKDKEIVTYNKKHSEVTWNWSEFLYSIKPEPRDIKLYRPIGSGEPWVELPHHCDITTDPVHYEVIKVVEVIDE